MRRLAADFRLFGNIFHDRNNILLRVGYHVNRDAVQRYLVGTKPEHFKLRFAYFSPNILRIQYKMRKRWGQIVVSLGLCHNF